MGLRSPASRDPHSGAVRRWHADQQQDAQAAPAQPDDASRDAEKPVALAADGPEKSLPALCLNGGPDRDTMRPIKEPCRVSTLSTPGNIFLGNVGPPGLPATGRDPASRTRVRPARPSVHRGLLYARRVCGLVPTDSSPAAPRCLSLIPRTGGGTSTAACSQKGASRNNQRSLS